MPWPRRCSSNASASEIAGDVSFTSAAFISIAPGKGTAGSRAIVSARVPTSRIFRRASAKSDVRRLLTVSFPFLRAAKYKFPFSCFPMCFSMMFSRFQRKRKGSVSKKIKFLILLAAS
jgi:hypothetical protein